MARIRLQDVFGIAERVRPASYVDRGGLDERLKYLLSANRHIVIHGESKQGKSWLRRHLLDEEQSVSLQCVSTSTPESLLEQALGRVGVHAELKRTATNSLEGQLRFDATTEARALLARLKGKASASGKAARSRAVENATFAQEPANLEWVARVLRQAGRRIVIEDFHYFPEEHRRLTAEWMKALGEYGLHLIVVGVWPETNFLTLYNGDLDGRVEDIELSWTAEELDRVLSKGSEALNVEITPTVRSRLVNASYGNVGLLQRLAEQLCQEEGVTEAQRQLRTMQYSAAYDRATRSVAEGMATRYLGFARAFVQGVGTAGGTDTYRHILRALLEFDDKAILAGVSRKDLASQIEQNAPGVVRSSDLTTALRRLGMIQERIHVRPVVLTYSADARHVYLADRALLFYRRFGNPTWPWEQPEPDELF
jgi:hypothetical protein